MRPRVKGALLLLLAFVLGAAAGATGFGLYLARGGWWFGPPRPERFQAFVLGSLARELDLKPEQRQQVEAIMRETGEEFGRLRQEIGPRFRDILARSRERIRQVLDPGQQAKFEALVDEWQRRAARRWRGRGEGGRGMPGGIEAGPGAGDRNRDPGTGNQEPSKLQR